MNQAETIRLNNGLRLVFYRLPHRNTVSINLRGDAGSRCEAEEQAGLAHLVEHLLFQGTHRWPSNYALTSQVELLGGEMWGATDPEYVSYWLQTPRHHLSQALPVFLDMLRSPLFAAQSVECEKEVILDELAEVTEQGWLKAGFLLDKALWPNHPLGRLLLGREETILSLHVDDVQTFFARHYSPERMVAAVVGDVPLEEVILLLDRAWGDWKTDFPPHAHTAPSGRSPTPLLHQDQDDGLLHLMFGFEIPPLDHPDLGAYTLLRTLLGEGMSSRLYRALRGDAGLCYSVESGVDELRHACVLYVYLAMQPSNVLKVLQRVCEVYHSLSIGKISGKELENSRGQAIGRLMMEADRVPFHARTLALSTFLTGYTLSVEEQATQLEDVNLDDLRRVAGATLRPGHLHAVFVGPLDEQTWQRCQEMVTTWA
jgi:predicted Zn-dependent peptidase